LAADGEGMSGGNSQGQYTAGVIAAGFQGRVFPGSGLLQGIPCLAKAARYGASHFRLDLDACP
jgi:hypothetical protein